MENKAKVIDVPNIIRMVVMIVTKPFLLTNPTQSLQYILTCLIGKDARQNTTEQ